MNKEFYFKSNRLANFKFETLAAKEKTLIGCNHAKRD
jgi:hypothetical protein